jgi:hypothetical protein
MFASRLTFALMLAAAPLLAQQEERPKVPKDSVEVTVTGCLKGRVLAAADVRQTDVQSGPIVRQHSFRLAGKKDVMKDVKSNDGQRVEVMGLIKKSALIEPGMRFKGGRIVVGGGSMGSGGSSRPPSPAENVVVMDVTSVTALGGECTR